MNYRLKQPILKAHRWGYTTPELVAKDIPIVEYRGEGLEGVCPDCGDVFASHGMFMYKDVDMSICPGLWIVNDGTIRLYEDKQFNKLYEVVK